MSGNRCGFMYCGCVYLNRMLMVTCFSILHKLFPFRRRPASDHAPHVSTARSALESSHLPSTRLPTISIKMYTKMIIANITTEKDDD